MTDKEMRTAIARERDYYILEHDDGGAFSLRHGREIQYNPWYRTEEEAWEDAPEFLTDRNAIHDALSTLTEDQWYQFYYEVLPSVVKPSGSCQSLQLFRATIKQLAEAFLRTIGKWKD